MAERTVISKITMKALGNPKVACAFTVGDGQLWYLGRIFGYATGLKQTVDDQGEVLFGLKGTFRALKADGSEINSGVCYLPGGVQESVSEAIPDDQGRIEFAFDIFTEASTNKAGYSYACKPLVEPSKEDPFEKFGAAMPEQPKIAKVPTAAEIADGLAAKEAARIEAAKK